MNTVDAFQGKECEVVVISTVRSNSRGTVGFLNDHRRLNVAITRARRGLIIVGNEGTLRHDRTWDAWLTWAHDQRVVVYDVG